MTRELTTREFIRHLITGGVAIGSGCFFRQDGSGVSGETHRASEYAGASGGAQIQAAINAADASPGPNVVSIGPNGPDDVSDSSGSVSDDTRAQNAWKIPQHISIPSYTTLVCSGAYLFLADGSDDNLVRNGDFSDGDEQISIVGDGNTTWDGNFTNQTNQDKTNENARLGLGFRFFGVDSLTVSGIKIRRTEAWGLKAENVANVELRNIEVEQGTNTEYTNRDGVHVVGPAEQVQISNIHGQSYDDMVAVGANEPKPFAYGDGPGGDVTNISIDTVDAELYHAHAVRIFEGDGGDAVHEVSVSDVSVENIDNSGGAVILGDGNAVDDSSRFSGISVSDISANGTRALRVASACRNVTVSSLTARRAPAVLKFVHGRNTAIDSSRSSCGGWTINSVTGEETQFVIDYQAAGGWEDSSITNLAYKSDGETPLVAIINFGGSSDSVKGCLFSGVTGFSDDGTGSPSGDVVRVRPGGASLEDSHITDINARKISGIFNIRNATNLFSNDVSVSTYDTVYKNLAGAVKFGGNVPPTDVRKLPLIKNSRAYHAPSINRDSNTEGPAVSDGSIWISLVDGSVIR